MTTDYLPEKTFQQLLQCLMPANALVLQLMMDTGMRISDALSMRRPEDWSCDMGKKYTYTEKKTGKKRTVFVPRDLVEALGRYCRACGESPYVFPGRDPEKPRTRQAVWKDLNRCAALWRVNGKKLRNNLGTHSARKVYAVNLRKHAEEAGEPDPIECVRIDMNHKDLSVAFLYAMADVISARKKRLTV